ncbi:MAG: hypothetical protein Q8Q06_03875 [bacterium]|nr:hypothetical protein [bacterium]
MKLTREAKLKRSRVVEKMIEIMAEEYKIPKKQPQDISDVVAQSPVGPSRKRKKYTHKRLLKRHS